MIFIFSGFNNYQNNYSFILVNNNRFFTTPGGLAAPEPNQKWVISPSLEMVGNRGFEGGTAGENSLALVPGMTFWHIRSGWQIHVGVQTPVSGPRDRDAMFLIQIGNHFNWGRLFGRGKTK